MKRFKVAILILALSLSTPALAMSDVMEVLIKESVETIGKHLLEKYVTSKKETNSTEKTTSPAPPPQTTATPAPQTYTTRTAPAPTPAPQDDGIIIIQ